MSVGLVSGSREADARGNGFKESSFSHCQTDVKETKVKETYVRETGVILI